MSSVSSLEVTTNTFLPVLDALFDARTTKGIDLIGSNTFPGSLNEFVLA